MIMEKDVVFLKNYPVSITAYLIYSLLWARVVYMQYRFSQQAVRSLSTGGEAIGLATFFTSSIGIILGLVMLVLYLGINPNYNTKFYGIMLLLIIAQLFILWWH